MTRDPQDLHPEPSDGLHVSPQIVRAVERYMGKLLRALDLGHWRVYVAQDKPPEGALLMIEPTDGRRVAMLYVSEGWAADDRSPKERQVDLTHEALHLAHHDQDEHIRRFLEGSGDISEYVKTLVLSQYTVNTERMVDSLSYVLAPHMPRWKDPK